MSLNNIRFTINGSHRTSSASSSSSSSSSSEKGIALKRTIINDTAPSFHINNSSTTSITSSGRRIVKPITNDSNHPQASPTVTNTPPLQAKPITGHKRLHNELSVPSITISNHQTNNGSKSHPFPRSVSQSTKQLKKEAATAKAIVASLPSLPRAEAKKSKTDPHPAADSSIHQAVITGVTVLLRNLPPSITCKTLLSNYFPSNVTVVSLCLDVSPTNPQECSGTAEAVLESVAEAQRCINLTQGKKMFGQEIQMSIISTQLEDATVPITIQNKYEQQEQEQEQEEEDELESPPPAVLPVAAQAGFIIAADMNLPRRAPRKNARHAANAPAAAEEEEEAAVGATYQEEQEQEQEQEQGNEYTAEAEEEPQTEEPVETVFSITNIHNIDIAHTESATSASSSSSSSSSSAATATSNGKRPPKSILKKSSTQPIIVGDANNHSSKKKNVLLKEKKGATQVTNSGLKVQLKRK